MKTLKMLYKIIYDDLKDADMLIGYAKTMVDEDQKRLADLMVVNAKTRLAHAMTIHEEFTNIVKAMKGEKGSAERVSDCLWDVTHEHFTEWYNELEGCIAKWK